MTNIKLGICPIGWTNDDMPDLGKENTFQQCVSEMALAGFTGCEIAAFSDILSPGIFNLPTVWFSVFIKINTC